MRFSDLRLEISEAKMGVMEPMGMMGRRCAGTDLMAYRLDGIQA